MVARVECGNAGADRVDDPHTFVAEDAARYAGCNVTFEDVQVCAANCGLHDFHYCIAGELHLGLWPVFERLQARSSVNQCLHNILL